MNSITAQPKTVSNPTIETNDDSNDLENVLFIIRLIIGISVLAAIFGLGWVI